MKKIIAVCAAIMASAGPVLAGFTEVIDKGDVVAKVPEMSATGAVVALAAIAAGGAIAWERRRNRAPKD